MAAIDDWEAIVRVYHNINKSRDLSKEETDRLEYAIYRARKCRSEMKYAAANRLKRIEQYAKKVKTPEYKAKARANFKIYYENNKAKDNRRCKAYRENNPEKYAAALAKKRERYAEQQRLKKESSNAL